MTPRPTRHALVVADGDVPSAEELDRAWPGWATDIETVIAADAGASRAIALGRPPDLVVGDLDSVDAGTLRRLKAAGVTVRRARVDKDESDAELAVLAAVEAGATRLTLLGAFGGPRLDHALANVWLLALPALVGREAVLLDGRTRVRLMQAEDDPDPARLDLRGRAGDVVTLLPFAGAAAGITTHGLRYPLAEESLVPGPARGLSNVRDDENAWVELSAGALLVIEIAAAR
jgi:thiamine pyrophosphokinase